MTLHWPFRRPPTAHRTRRRLPHITPQALYLSVIVVIATGFGFAVWNIYRMVERTLTSSEAVFRLRQDVAQETFRSEDFTRALKHFEAKQQQAEPSGWDTLNNPFRQGE